MAWILRISPLNVSAPYITSILCWFKSVVFLVCLQSPQYNFTDWLLLSFLVCFDILQFDIRKFFFEAFSYYFVGFYDDGEGFWVDGMYHLFDGVHLFVIAGAHYDVFILF